MVRRSHRDVDCLVGDQTGRIHEARLDKMAKAFMADGDSACVVGEHVPVSSRLFLARYHGVAAAPQATTRCAVFES